MPGQILVVEDNVVNQEVLRHFLSQLGFDCHVVSTATQALAAVDENQYALIFMDLRLPDQDGFAATRAIREKGHQLPIIAITASTEDDDKRKALEVGINAYLSKPFSIADFESVLERWLGRLPGVGQGSNLGADC